MRFCFFTLNEPLVTISRLNKAEQGRTKQKEENTLRGLHHNMHKGHRFEQGVHKQMKGCASSLDTSLDFAQAARQSKQFKTL